MLYLGWIHPFKWQPSCAERKLNHLTHTAPYWICKYANESLVRFSQRGSAAIAVAIQLV